MEYKKQWRDKVQRPICKKGEVYFNTSNSLYWLYCKCDDCISSRREALREQCIKDSKYLPKLEEV